MKILKLCLILCCSLLYYTPVKAQTGHDYQLLGSFVFQGTVFNYTYKLSANGVSSFAIEQVTGNKTDLNDIHVRLSNIIQQSKKLQLADSLGASIDRIDKYITDGLTNLKSAGDGLATVITTYTSAADNLRKDIKTDKDTAKSDTANNATRNKINDIITLANDLNNIKIQVSKIQISKESTISDFTFDAFKNVLPAQLKYYYQEAVITANKSEINKIADDKFIEIKARVKFDDDEPSTAYLKLLSDKVYIYFTVSPSDSAKKGLLKKIRSVLKNNQNDAGKESLIPVQVKVEYVQFEFEAGTIKNIYAEFSSLEDPKKKFLFQNTIPISISGKFASGNLTNNRIFSINSDDIASYYNKYLNDKLSVSGNKAKIDGDSFFNLAELIQYVLILENHKEDYSPDDKVYNLSPLQSTIELKKRRRSKILTVKAFSDFNGINGDKPNGLIQFEGNVHANINTYRWQIKRFNIGILTGADLVGSLNKIDDNNRYLTVTEANLDQSALAQNKKVFQIQPIDMFSHQISGIALNANIFKFSLPDFGLTFNANVNYGLMLTAVSDSLVVKKNAFTKIASPNQRNISGTNFITCSSLEFSPEGRYGFYINYGWDWLNINNEEFKRTDDLKSQVQILEFGGFISTNTDSKLFFRWRKSSQVGNQKINYNQIQVGYLVDIFKQSK